MSDQDLLSEIMAAFDVPEELRDWVVTPDPWQLRFERYKASLPRRMDEVAAVVNEACADMLPEGMHFEWEPELGCRDPALPLSHDGAY